MYNAKMPKRSSNVKGGNKIFCFLNKLYAGWKEDPIGPVLLFGTLGRENGESRL